VTPPSDLVVAGWPLAVTFAAALVGECLTARRRRTAANHALHELRRPLQAMALMEQARADQAGNGSGARNPAAALDSAIVAAGDLERVINGDGDANDRRPVSCDEVIAAAIERWEPLAARLGVSLRFSGPRQSGTLLVDPRRLDQALDNLIANAVEHGGPLIDVGVRVSGGQARIAVRDSGARQARLGRPAHPSSLPVAGGRRGNGLRIVGSVARSHQGRFAFHRSPSGSVAVIDLPLAAPRVGAA
jgi:signal transduction histidine kinase